MTILDSNKISVLGSFIKIRDGNDGESVELTLNDLFKHYDEIAVQHKIEPGIHRLAVSVGH